jgi:hypothetical protein
VDELVVSADLGEGVDARLVDLDPVAAALGLAQRRLHQLVRLLAVRQQSAPRSWWSSQS